MFSDLVGFTDIVFEGDCQEVVRAATRVEENWTLFGPVIHDIK